MGVLDFMKGEPTLVDRQSERYATPKHAIPTRLAEKTDDDRAEQRAEKACRKEVIKQDGKICRCCKRVVVQQLELAENRLEVHHVAGRVEKAIRWDPRNCLVLCQACHEKVTRHRLVIMQLAKYLFRINSQTHINARKKVTFVTEAA